MVVAYGPECAGKTGWKSRRRTLSVWIENGEIRVHSHADVDWRVCRDWVLQKLGLPPWQPGRRNAPSPKPKPLPPLEKRNAFLGESLASARDRGHVTFDQLSLIINDLKNACPADEVESRATEIAGEFGYTEADAIDALRPAWRPYEAAERAKVFQVTFATYRRLGLRRSGCVDVDPAERRRLTHQRYNAKRRARRAKNPSERFAKIARNFLSSSAVTTIRDSEFKEAVKVISDEVCLGGNSYESVNRGCCHKNYARPRAIGRRQRGARTMRGCDFDRAAVRRGRLLSRSVWCDPP
jgi:hypothetical protein